MDNLNTDSCQIISDMNLNILIFPPSRSLPGRFPRCWEYGPHPPGGHHQHGYAPDGASRPYLHAAAARSRRERPPRKPGAVWVFCLPPLFLLIRTRGCFQRASRSGQGRAVCARPSCPWRPGTAAYAGLGRKKGGLCHSFRGLSPTGMRGYRIGKKRLTLDGGQS